MDRVLILADTPNLFRRVRDPHGASANPDYDGIYWMAASFGDVTRAIGFVNDGVSDEFAQVLKTQGFETVYSHAFDVDHILVATAVELHSEGDWLMLCSGDGDFLPLVKILQSVGRRVAVVAEPSCCSKLLRQAADRFLPVPVLNASVFQSVHPLRPPAWA